MTCWLQNITTSGQLSIRWIEKYLNQYLNKILGTDNKDYVLASDTDSVYITFDELVNKSFKTEGDQRVRVVYKENEWLDSG